MLYYLFEYINKIYDPPGFDIFRFLTFRSAIAAMTGLFLAFYIGPKVIKILSKYQIGEAKKEEGPKFHWSKAGTPTMGGVIIIFSVIIPVLLWADVKSTYVILITVGTLWLGAVGFLDDYLKVIKKYPNGLIALVQLFISLLSLRVLIHLPQFRFLRM
jgi:phospho-N-acetylmuramoyl-pentapeptide-transferase